MSLDHEAIRKADPDVKAAWKAKLIADKPVS